MRIARSSETGWLRSPLRDMPEMINDRAKQTKAARRRVAAAAKAQRMSEKQQRFAARRRERRRIHLAAATRKRVARVQGHMMWAARTVGSGSAWRKQVARLKGRVKALIGYAS
jgi:hypothetical protein